MTKVIWDEIGKRFYEAGIDRVVFYPQVGSGVAWNGLTSIKENPSGGDSTLYYVDGQSYHNEQSGEEFTAVIEAFTYPDEFSEYDGFSAPIQQSFGLSYRKKIGSDIDDVDYGYKLHLVYNITASPSDKEHVTLDASLDPMNFSWDLTTTPISIDGVKPSSHLIIDATKAYPNVLISLEDRLYGNEEQFPTLPSPDEVISLFDASAILIIINNGDGTFTASGPDNVVSFIDSTSFQISSESAIYMDAVTYTVYSL